MRQRGSEAHFLPSCYVLKPQSSGSMTQVRLILDPSMGFNQNLLGTICIENKIADVLRKLQSLPIVAIQDIREVYFRMMLTGNNDKSAGGPSSSGPLAFLMNCETGKDGVETLTAKKTATSRLVAILVLVAVMGISQSGLFLSLAKAGLDFQDETLEFLIRELSYADDLHSGGPRRTVPLNPVAENEKTL